MYRISTMNKIAAVGLDRFDRENYEVAGELNRPDAIIVRSAKLHDMEMPDTLKAIARAGAGVNNIPVAECTAKGIVVFNTPGANANAVKELVIAALLLASRGIIKGVEWTNTLKGTENISKQVEDGKKNFAGTEIKGKTLGIIGLGAIGVSCSCSVFTGYEKYDLQREVCDDERRRENRQLLPRWNHQYGRYDCRFGQREGFLLCNRFC